MKINEELVRNLKAVQATISQAAIDAGRNPNDINLIGVSKEQPAERIDASLAAGLRVYGENRVQEAEIRWVKRRRKFSGLELHLIGPLQTNKVRSAVRLFDVIQTVDRERLAYTLSRIMAEEGRNLPCFVQVNTGEEEQKAGISPGDTDAFVRTCIDQYSLNIVGLMCIPPAADVAAPHFAFLQQMADQLNLPYTSMGMSSDYPAAVELGATHVRVGSAIFGNRASNVPADT
ncbi:MAG: YggS family pyridoxal phosphate-dependent enzyme [Alphaproteobacteria bacterium]